MAGLAPLLIQFISQTWIRKVLQFIMIHVFTHLFLHSHVLFHKYLFQALSVLGTSLGTGDTTVKKRQSLTSKNYICWAAETQCWQQSLGDMELRLGELAKGPWRKPSRQKGKGS